MSSCSHQPRSERPSGGLPRPSRTAALSGPSGSSTVSTLRSSPRCVTSGASRARIRAARAAPGSRDRRMTACWRTPPAGSSSACSSRASSSSERPVSRQPSSTARSLADSVVQVPASRSRAVPGSVARRRRRWAGRCALGRCSQSASPAVAEASAAATHSQTGFCAANHRPRRSSTPRSAGRRAWSAVARSSRSGSSAAGACTPALAAWSHQCVSSAVRMVAPAGDCSAETASSWACRGVGS